MELLVVSSPCERDPTSGSQLWAGMGRDLQVFM